MVQFDIVNVFAYVDLDKIVFMGMLPGHGKNRKVLCLNNALYSLQQFPLLWQQKITNKLKKLGFKEIPQKLCLVQKNGIIGFFYINDIVFTYKKEQKNHVDQVVELL